MHTLPPVMTLLRFFAPLFSKRVWEHAQVFLMGAILAHAPRTVTAAQPMPVTMSTHQALLCPDLTVAPEQIVAWFVSRWQMEVALAEVTLRQRMGSIFRSHQ